MKKTLSLLVALLILVSCSAALAEGYYSAGDTYPLQSDVTLTWFVSNGYILNDAYAKYEDSPFHSGLSKMTGVNIEWLFPTPGTEANQAFNLMLASDKLPDIMFHGVMGDAERYMAEGVIRDLTDKMPEFSPAYYQFITSNPTYSKWMKTDSGKYYGYGFFREDGGWNDTYQGPVIRKDWLDKLGLEAPATISDWTNVLTAFNKEFGATFSAPWSRFKQGGFSGAFGAFGMSDLAFYVDDAGKVNLAQSKPEWRDYMLQLNAWWEAGLVDQDLFTIDDTAVKAKALAGNTGFGYTSMGQLSNWVKEAADAGNGAEWMGLQYPKGDDGKLSMVFGGYGVGDCVAFITGDCDDSKVETAMRVLDYAYTDKGNLYWNFGTEGTSWSYDAEGKPAYTDLVTKDPDGLNNAISKYGGSTWQGSCIQATQLLYMKNTPVSIAANDLWFYPNEAVASKWKMPSGVTLTADESSEVDFLQSAITTYVAECAAKLVTGEMKEADFDGYVAQLESMGLSTILGIRQAAYDRYLAR